MFSIKWRAFKTSRTPSLGLVQFCQISTQKNYLFADVNRKLMYRERGGEWTNWGKETAEKRCKQERPFDLRGLVSNDCQCMYVHFWLPWSVISTTLPGLGDCDVALPCSCGLASWLRCSPPSSTFSTFSSSSSTSLRPQPREGVRDGTVPPSPPLPHSLAGDLHIWSEMMGTFTIVKINGIVICKLTFYFASQSIFNILCCDYIYNSKSIYIYIHLCFDLLLHLNRFSTCSCDLPHTLRCDGDLPDGEKKAEVVSLLDFFSFAKVMSSYLCQSNYQFHNCLLLVRLWRFSF